MTNSEHPHADEINQDRQRGVDEGETEWGAHLTSDEYPSDQ